MIVLTMSGIEPERRRNFVTLNTQASVDSVYLDSGPFDIQNQGWRKNNMQQVQSSREEQSFAQVKHKL